MKKKPRFFCDNCNYEVNNDVKTCPYCGRFFTSVRCPACSYSGPDRMFQSGCPMCGYSAPPPPKIQKTKQILSQKVNQNEPLPFWTYIAVFIVILALVALLSYLITR